MKYIESFSFFTFITKEYSSYNRFARVKPVFFNILTIIAVALIPFIIIFAIVNKDDEYVFIKSLIFSLVGISIMLFKVISEAFYNSKLKFIFKALNIFIEKHNKNVFEELGKNGIKYEDNTFTINIPNYEEKVLINNYMNRDLIKENLIKDYMHKEDLLTFSFTESIPKEISSKKKALLFMAQFSVMFMLIEISHSFKESEDVLA